MAKENRRFRTYFSATEDLLLLLFIAVSLVFKKKSEFLKDLFFFSDVNKEYLLVRCFTAMHLCPAIREPRKKYHHVLVYPDMKKNILACSAGLQQGRKPFSLYKYLFPVVSFPPHSWMPKILLSLLLQGSVYSPYTTAMKRWVSFCLSWSWNKTHSQVCCTE